MMASGTVIVAFVLGAITGAAVALLVAPASGEETRRMLAEKAREGREKAGEVAQQGARALGPAAGNPDHGLRARQGSLRAGAGAAARQANGGDAVNEWSQVFLGVIAVATAMMARGADLRHRRAVARVGAGAVDCRDHPERHSAAHLRANAIAEEASKTAILATAQAQKIDRMVTDLTRRVDETSAVIQQAILTPAREGMAIFAAFKAGFNVLKGLGMRDMRGRHGGVDDEDALFIG